MGRTALTAVGVAAAVAALLGGVGAWLALHARSAQTGVEHALIGDALLTYPAAYARVPMATAAGRLDRLDLAATFPDFQPAGVAAGALTEAALADRAARTIFITVTPDDKSLEPAERPARLYAPFLEPMGFTHPGGLVSQRFQRGSPYEGEELHQTPPEGRAFWARCPSEGAREGQGDLREPCFTEMRREGLNLVVRFSPALLPDWERLRDGVVGLMARFRQRG